MGVGTVVTAGAAVRRAPRRAPLAAVILVGIIGAVRVVALDVGEVEEHFAVIFAVGADLVVAGVKGPRGARAVEVPRHIDEDDVGVGLLEGVHLREIGVDAGCGVVARATTPGPDHHFDAMISRAQRIFCRRDPRRVAVVAKVAIVLDEGRHGVFRAILCLQHVQTADDLAPMGSVAIEYLAELCPRRAQRRGGDGGEGA